MHETGLRSTTNRIAGRRTPEQEYYENERLWAQDLELDPDERARLDLAVALVPADMRSVLDVGCGNGAFVHRLDGKYERLVGVDRSEAALQFVRTEKLRASVSELPFGDGEFDLVSCMEVVEHLPEGTYERALAELVRVSRSWIMIGVPYRENRRLGLVRCPRCLCEFNRSYHLRDFDGARMRTLFSSVGRPVEPVEVRTVGRTARYLGLRAARRLVEPFRTLGLPAGVVCPQCSHGTRAQGAEASAAPSRGTLLGRARVLWPRISQARWFLALYRKC